MKKYRNLLITYCINGGEFVRVIKSEISSQNKRLINLLNQNGIKHIP